MGEVREVAERVGTLELELLELEAKVLAQMDTVPYKPNPETWTPRFPLFFFIY